MDDNNLIESRLKERLAGIPGESEYKAFLSVLGYFSGYSLNNCLMIYEQMPEASMLMTYDAWQDKGYNLRGLKSIRILAPGADGKVKQKPVFDISQMFEVAENIKNAEKIISPATRLLGDLHTNAEHREVFAEVLGRLYPKSADFGALDEKMLAVSDNNASIYAVCSRFGINSPKDLNIEQTADILPINAIKTETYNIIKAIENNFAKICKEKGIEAYARIFPKRKVLEPPPEILTETPLASQPEEFFNSPEVEPAEPTEPAEVPTDTRIDVPVDVPIFDFSSGEIFAEQKEEQEQVEVPTDTRIDVPADVPIFDFSSGDIFTEQKEEQEQAEQTPPPKVIEPALPRNIKAEPVYTLSYADSVENGSTVIYQINAKINQMCADFIDQSIAKTNSTEKTIKMTIKKYGQDRLLWVLARYISYALDSNQGYSKKVQNWAKRYTENFITDLNSKPHFSFNSAVEVLDALTNEFLDYLSRPMSFKDRMKNAKKLANKHNASL